MNAKQGAVLCWLATADLNGQPNVSPKELWEIKDDKIIIAQVASPKSRKNISVNLNVCVSTVNIFTQKGTKYIGKAQLVQEGDQDYKRFAASLLLLAGEDFPFREVIVVDIEKEEAILAPRYRFYPETTEENQIADSWKSYQVDAYKKKLM